MNAPEYAITHEVGDSLSGISWQWLDATGAPVDLSDYTASMVVWDAAGTAVLTLTSTPAVGLSIPTPTNGTVVLNATAAQLTALVAGSFTYRMRVTKSDSSVIRTLSKGVLLSNPQTPLPANS